MKLKATLFGLIAIVAILLSSTFVVAETEATGTINTPAVHLRTEPSLNSSSFGLINKDATCVVLDERVVGDSQWYQVRITSKTLNKVDLKGVTGWVFGNFLTVTQRKEDNEDLTPALSDVKSNDESEKAQDEDINDESQKTQNNANHSTDQGITLEQYERCNCPCPLVKGAPTLICKIKMSLYN